MLRRSVTLAIAVLMFSSLGRAQNARPAPAPAPRHDISGIWDPATGRGDGIGGIGSKAMPEDGKPEHQLPYTPLGLEALKRTKPTNGTRSVLPGDTNDPVFAYGD